jgi:putative selenate reductase
MDAARVAKRLKGVKDVTVLYRRTEREMPADREEYREAVEEGVVFNFLSNPESLEDGAVRIRKMALGSPDESGRRRPVETGEVYSLPASFIVAAISETVDADLLKTMGLSFDGKGPRVNSESCATADPGVYLLGDARTGPSTIVACIAEGRKAVDHILANRQADAIVDPGPVPTEPEAIPGRKGRVQESLVPEDRADFAAREMERCLECHAICNKCVDVCPNRANIALPVEGFGHANQILHIDAYCNECGNCGQFCPWEGNPYKDKLTIFNLETDFNHSDNSGFFWNGRTGFLRVGKSIYTLDRQNEVLGVREKTEEPLDQILSVIDQVEKDYSYLLGPVTEY